MRKATPMSGAHGKVTPKYGSNVIGGTSGVNVVGSTSSQPYLSSVWE